MPREFILYIDDMIKACRKIIRYTDKLSFEQFRHEEMIYDAALRNLKIIGEASKNIPIEIKIQMKEVDWRKVVGLRDVLAHAYFGIDDSIIWDVIKERIPQLQAALSKFLDK